MSMKLSYITGFFLITMSFDLVLVWRHRRPGLAQADASPVPGLSAWHPARRGRIIGVARDDLTTNSTATDPARFDQVELAKRPSRTSSQRLPVAPLPAHGPVAPERLRLRWPRCAAQRRHRGDVPGHSTPCSPPSASSLVAGAEHPHTRIVLEKPLGHDLVSNRAINEAVRQVFQRAAGLPHRPLPGQAFGAEPVCRCALAMRCLSLCGGAKPLPTSRSPWPRNWAWKSAAPSTTTGALRDMVQNHALQLLCAIGMEPPINAHADAIRDEKLKVLRSLKPWTLKPWPACHSRPVRAGNIRVRRCPPTATSPGVSRGQPTETFVALRTEIANWRWAGVPFYIRTGKRLAGATRALWSTSGPRRMPSSTRKSVWPTAWSSTCSRATGWNCTCWPKPRTSAPAWQSILAPVHLDLDFDKRFGAERVGAYERLLLDVIDGRLNLFVRSDEQEEAWRWVEPILGSGCRQHRPPRPMWRAAGGQARPAP
jgi:glucose-6-phosphate 1-dehydrogenase